MGNVPTLSVVLPNYNHGRWLTRSVPAILEQTFAPLEVIVFDDDSTDNSRDILKVLAAKYPAIRLILNKPRRGLFANFEAGMRQSRGDYIYMGAADDWVAPGYFARAMALAQANPHAGVLLGPMIERDEAGKAYTTLKISAWDSDRYVSPDQFLEEYMMREGPVWSIGPSAIYRRDALLEAGGLDPTVGPLADIYLMQVVARRYGACFTPQLAVNYLINPNTYSGSTSLRQRLRFGKRMTEWMRAAPELFPERFVRSWWSRYCRWACKHHLASFLQRKLPWFAPIAKRAYRLLAG